MKAKNSTTNEVEVKPWKTQIDRVDGKLRGVYIFKVHEFFNNELIAVYPDEFKSFLKSIEWIKKELKNED